jgi:medium-chain acyl-[acyl-carrier-protein] hydrolase
MSMSQADCDPPLLFAYLLNSAWKHTIGTSYSYEQMSARNLVWVLSHIQIAIKRLPMWGEHITIETWGKRIVKFFALRDFAVTSQEGEKLISATSSWMILDRTSGRVQRFDPKSDVFPWQPEKEEIETDLERIPELIDGRELARFRVLFSDIDVNRHVNSSKYLQWIIDSHSYEHLEATEVRSIELRFLSEALANDEVAVFSEVAGEKELCSLRRTDDSKELCRARIQWHRST